MINKKNKIFTNLYNKYGSDLISSLKRGDWKDTLNITKFGRENLMSLDPAVRSKDPAEAA